MLSWVKSFSFKLLFNGIQRTLDEEFAKFKVSMKKKFKLKEEKLREKVKIKER